MPPAASCWRSGCRPVEITALPHDLIGDFIRAVVQDPPKAEAMLRQTPALLNARWMHDETVLHFLAIEDYADAVRFLAEHGAEIDAVNEFGDTALVDVAGLGNPRMAETLLGHGANPNAASATYHTTLAAAVRSANPRLVELLLEAGANPHYRTRSETVFDTLAEADGNHEAIRALLMRYGATPDSDEDP